MNLGNYIDELKAVFVARNGLSDIGYKDWYSWGNGELKDTYLKKYVAQLKGLNLEQANLALSTQLLSNSQKEAILVEAGLVASKDKIKASLVESALAQNIDSEATRNAILKKLKLTQANSVLVASDKECTEVELRRILTESGIVGVEQERIVTATGVATAQTGEITSTNLLSLAVEKLGMKLGITNAQMAGFKLGVGIFAAVAAAGTAVFALYKNYQRQMDEAVKAASEAGSEIDENTKSINEQIEKVKELREQLADNSTTQEEAKNIKQELLGIQDSLVEKYGKEAESINLVNGNLEKQIDLLNDLSESQLKDYFKDEENRKGADESTKRMTEKKTYNLGNISSGSESYDIVTDIVKDFKDKGLELVGGSGGMAGAAFTIKINGDAKSVESTISEVMDKLDEAKKGADEATVAQIESLQDSMSKSYSKASDIVEENEANYLRDLANDMLNMGDDSGDPYDIYKQYAKSIDELNKALADGEGVEKARGNYENIGKSVDAVLKKNNEFKPLFDQLNEQLDDASMNLYKFTDAFNKDSNLKSYAESLRLLGYTVEDVMAFNSKDGMIQEGEEGFEKLKDKADEYGISVDTLIDKLVEWGFVQDDVAQKVDDTTNADYIGKLADASKILSGLEDSYKEFKENGFVLAETISAIPEELQKLEGFDLFSKIIGDPTSGQEKIQQAFNDIVHEYLVSSETLSNLINADESTLQTYIANLKEIGVTNAEEVVTAAKTCINEENELITAAETEWLNGHIQLVNGKIKADSDYINDVNSKNTSLIKALGSTYRSDYDNWTNLLAGKATAHNNFINAIKGSQINLGDGSSALSDYGKAKAIVNKWNSASFKNNNGNDPLNLSNNTRNGISKEAYEKAKAFMTYYDQYKSMTDALKIDLSNISTDFKTDYSPKIEGKKDEEKKAKEQEKAKEQTSQTFDFIETRIDRLESKISKFQKRAEDAKRSFSSRIYNYKKEISTLFSELKTQNKAYDRYMQKANSVGLSEEWKKKVRNGAISIKDVKDDALKEQIESYQTWYEKAKKAKDATDDLTRSIQDEYEALAKLNSEYAESKVEKYSSSIDLLEAKKENYVKYQSKNNMLSKESSYLDKELSAYQKAYRNDKTELNSAKKSINRTKTTKANKSILKNIKSCVNSGKEISSSTLSKALSIDSGLYNKCLKYNAYLAAYETDKATYDLQKQENISKKADLAQEKLDNIDTYYSNRRQGYEQRANELNSAIDINEAKGYQISTKYYSRLISEEKKNNASLVEERKKLVKSLADSLKNGSVKMYSDEWYEMSKQIDDITNSIDESTKSLVEYKNQLRQIKWDNFDYLEERIKTVTSEIDFMINELSREDLTSDDTGDFTDRGKAVAYLHASNYTAYLNQAKDYEKEVSKIEKELAKDPYNKTLIERKEELVKSYQDAISAAQEEKYTIIDLYTQGYEAMKNHIADLISEYEKLMDAEKNAYDWQNNVAEKTKQIADLRKQLLAYSGDMSEESHAKIQSLTVSLKDSEKDLRESQYEKFISDSKDMLSDLQDNFDDVIQDVIDALSEHFDKLLNGISSTSNTAVRTIKEQMKGVGYTSTNEFSQILNGTNVVTATNNLIVTIKEFQSKMIENANKLADSTSTTTGAQSVKDSIRSKGVKTLSKAVSSSQSATAIQKTKIANAKLSRDEAKLNRDNLKKQYKDYIKTHRKNSSKAKELKDKYDAANSNYNELNKSYNIQNAIYKDMKKQNNALNYLQKHLNVTDSSRDKLSDLNKALYDKYGQRILSESEMKELAKLLGVKFDNKNKSGNLYKKLKEIGVPGFKVGSRNIPKDMLAVLGEEGNELHFSKEQGILKEVGQGDKIFTNEQAQNLWKLSQLTPVDWSKNLNLSSLNIPKTDRNTTTIVEVGDIVMNGVNDKEAFAKELRNEICKGGKTTKCIAEVASSSMLGKGIGKAKLYR